MFPRRALTALRRHITLSCPYAAPYPRPMSSSSSAASSPAVSSLSATSPPTSPPSPSLEDLNARYRPYLQTKNAPHEPDWVDQLELERVQEMQRAFGRPVKILVLYGSLRERSFSKLTAFESSRILHRLGADVRIFDPSLLPMKGAPGTDETHEKVVELRGLSTWSDGQVWVCPEQHGTVTAVFKNQIDWIPLSLGSVRPTQGRTCALVQVNGGSQSFNVLGVLRNLGRWMRMWVQPNQSSIPQVYSKYTTSDRLMPSSNRDRLVDVMEELVKFTVLLAPFAGGEGGNGLLDDRYSEREEKREFGRLRSQEETERAKREAEEMATMRK